MEGKKHGSIYEREEILPIETERLKHENFAHPDEVSIKLFENIDLTDKKVLDVGAGPDPKLGDLIDKNGGQYIALDVNMSHLKKRKESAEKSEKDIYFIRGDVKALPIKPESVNFAHERFVLMHLPPEARLKAIQEIVAAAKNEAMFLEYNWETLASKTHEELLNQFKEIAFEMFSKVRIEKFEGKYLEAEVREALSEIKENLTITANSDGRKGKFGEEIYEVIGSLTELAKKILKDEALTNRLIDIKDKFSKVVNEIELTPPDINYVVVNKQPK